MAQILSGKEVAQELNQFVERRVAKFKRLGIVPCLAIIRVGNSEDDIAYERSAVMRAEKVGVAIKTMHFSEGVPDSEVIRGIHSLNNDSSVHGILLLRPLPPYMDDRKIRNALCSAKDVDGITDESAGALMVNNMNGFAPCTAEACLRILDHYGFDVAGKRAVVLGRSTVIGKPVAMMLLQRNATVTICHSRTEDLAGVTREGDVVVAAIGREGMVDASFLREGQVVIDVGINIGEDGKIHGDVNADAAQVTEAYTPVPGGVGSVTTALLMRHVLLSAERMNKDLLSDDEF